MGEPRISTDLFLSTAEAYTDFQFAPQIIMRDKAFSPCLRLVDKVDVFISINQLEILKATIGAFLEAQKEKAQAVAAALVDEATEQRNNEIRSVVTQDATFIGSIL